MLIKPIVQKYGGTSLADPDKLFSVARRVQASHESGRPIVVVVSAQGGMTDDLYAKAREVNPNFNKRELDVLLSTGEQQAAALLTMALHGLGMKAVSLNAAQVGIFSSSVYGDARIENVQTDRILEELGKGQVVVVTGFQGINSNGDVTTLGRGASDTTVVALAAALGSPVCEIFTDVDGIYTADPRVVPKAVKLNAICYDDMLGLVSSGVIKPHCRAVEMAKRFKVVLHVCSSLTSEPGTYIKEDVGLERLHVSGLAIDKNLALVSLKGLPDRADFVSEMFTKLADENILVDLIVGSNPAEEVRFTVNRQDAGHAVDVLMKFQEFLGFEELSFSLELAKLSIVGAGMVTNSGVAATMFRALSKSGAKIHLITTSETKVSVLIDENLIDEAANAVHDVFLPMF